jgi:hypothetical protein
MATKRHLSDSEKQSVRAQQISEDGSLRCFISGEIIHDGDLIEYDNRFAAYMVPVRLFSKALSRFRKVQKHLGTILS